MTNKILELAEEYAEVYSDSYYREHKQKMLLALQAEVNRMEAELAAAKADIERYVRIASEQGAKLAALEAQNSAMRRSLVIHRSRDFPFTDQQAVVDKEYPLLHLAAGAKEKP